MPEPLLRALDLTIARRVEGLLPGDHRSALLGRGSELAQIRPYEPVEDDVRQIDWNVTARSGVPHVKQFIEERDLTIIIAVDVSGSMAFGSVDWRKCDIAAELASVFAFSAVSNSDRVGLLLFSERIRKYIPPRRGRAHAQIIVRAAVDAAMNGTRGAADLEPAARFLERVSAKRAVVILLSDFLDGSFEAALKRLNRKHDLIAISIADPREERFPDRGLARIVDAETGETRLVDLRRTEITRRASLKRQQLERRFRTSGVDWLPVSTALPYDRDLLRFFRDRIARRR